MLEHINNKPLSSARVVILGAAGFVGHATRQALEAEGTPVLPIGRTEIDLLANRAGNALAQRLTPADTLVVISAEAPCKDPAMLVRNTQMMGAVCDAIRAVQPKHVIYVSSDAVYKDIMEPITETCCAEPGALHGTMHITREAMLRETVKGDLAILRPTLIYGADDPHNGYGPNRFQRLAEKGETIVLFGEGEERRDHVHVDDVAELIRLIATHRSHGLLNAATGDLVSFREVAEMIARLSDTPVRVKGSPRIGAMPHNGYREFDPAATFEAFPGFHYRTPAEGFALVNAQRRAEI
jgi:UDP-glucose 4-epimerase